VVPHPSPSCRAYDVHWQSSKYNVLTLQKSTHEMRYITVIIQMPYTYGTQNEAKIELYSGTHIQVLYTMGKRNCSSFNMRGQT
jgi:hypothetical protein